MAIQSELPPVASRLEDGSKLQLPKRGGSVGWLSSRALSRRGPVERLSLGSNPERQRPAVLRLERGQEKKLSNSGSFGLIF